MDHFLQCAHCLTVIVNSFLSKNSSNSIDMFRLIFVSFLNTPKSTKPLLFSEAIFSTILAHFNIVFGKNNVFQKFCITVSEKLIY